jgi:hypothetical protein
VVRVAGRRNGNPVDFPVAYGFWDGASSKVGAMLIGRDVSEPA